MQENYGSSPSSHPSSTYSSPSTHTSSGTSLGRDVILWLNSKLEEPWSSDRLAPLLTGEILESINSKFCNLETAIKLKVLFSLLSVRKKTLEELKASVEQLFILSEKDEDEWVRVISHMLSCLLTEKNMNFSSNFENQSFQTAKEEIIETVQQLPNGIQFYPLEYPYLSTKLVSKLNQTMNQNLHFKCKVSVDATSIKEPIKKKVIVNQIFEETMQSDQNDIKENHLKNININPSMSPIPKPRTEQLEKASSLFSPGGSSGLLERKGYQKRTKMLDFEEVQALTQKQETAKKKQKISLEQDLEKEKKKKEREEASEKKETGEKPKKGRKGKRKKPRRKQ